LAIHFWVLKQKLKVITDCSVSFLIVKATNYTKINLPLDTMTDQYGV